MNAKIMALAANKRLILAIVADIFIILIALGVLPVDLLQIVEQLLPSS